MAPEVLKILAVDDLPDNLITLKAVLRDALPAARVLTAANGPAGIALARAEDPDVILLDIIMPEMDGFAVCRALKADERTAGIPVVFLTALRGDRKNRVEALEAGAEGFLAKPLDEIELVAQIRAMTKIKAAHRAQQSERERLAALVAERTHDLKQQLAARVHAEALERKQAAKLSSIYRAAPVGVGMVINRVIQEVNDTFCEMTGYARAELLGRSARLLYPTDADYDFVGHEKYRQIAQGGSGSVETRWRRKDGVSIDILLSSAALDLADLTRGVVFTALDITERKRAEAALRESEARYRRLTDNARDIIFRYNLVPEIRLTYINPAVEDLTGYSPAECYADPQLMLNLMHPADRPMMAGFMATLPAPDQPFTMRWIGKDGGVRWMESRVVPVYDAAGQLVAVEGITRDTTARVQAEAALQESEARYRAIFENMAAACCVDEVIFENGQAVDYRILDVNPAFERITGIPRSQAANALASELYGTGQAPFLDIYSRVAATGEPAAFEAHFAPINKDLYITVGSPGPGRFSTVFSDITERKQAEQALRQANERLSLAQRAAGAGMWNWDITTGKLEWSPEFFQLFGLNPDTSAATFDVWREMLHPQDRQQAEERINDAIRDRIPLTNEYRIVMPSGEVRWIYALGDTLYDMQGQPTRMAGICLNITERKQAEAALRERENMLQKIFDILPIGLWFADKDGRLLRGNPAGVAIWGAEPKVAPAEYGVFKARRLPAGDEIAPDDWALAHTIREGVTVVDELLEIEAFDGQQKIILNYTAPVLDEAGAVLGAVVVNQDVTERVRAETELRRVNHFLDTIIENIPDMIFLKDAAGLRFVRLNRAGENLLGFSRAELLGKNDYDFFPPKEAEFFIQKDRQTLRGKAIVDIPDELIQTRVQGQRRLHTKKVPLLDAHGEPEYLLGISEDITERVQAEERLRATLAELQRSNADLERFAYIASHDLQEPLRMVSSYAQLLGINYRGRLDADADEFIGYLVEGAMRMHQLLLDLLDYSSLNTSTARPEPTDAALSYEMARNSLEPLITETAATLTCDPLPTVLAEPAQLTQIFAILIGNAIKFRGAEPPRVHVSARQTFEVCETSKVFWEFTVRDNGIGIEPQYFERIFVIFQRLHTRRKYQGNGIGLAICKRIIERHGGRIWVESQPGQGSTFYFTLPAAG